MPGSARGCTARGSAPHQVTYSLGAPLGARLARITAAAPRLRWLLVALLVASIATLAFHRQHVWSHELSALSPVSKQSLALDG